MAVTSEGGSNPVWNPHGGELFYQVTNSVFAVQIVNGRRVGSPTRLFARPTSNPDGNWDVAADGQRFLVAGYTRPPQINVVLNWFEELRAKVPQPR